MRIMIMEGTTARMIHLRLQGRDRPLATRNATRLSRELPAYFRILASTFNISRSVYFVVSRSAKLLVFLNTNIKTSSVALRRRTT
ncbi:hypothetical protein TOPH_08908 [Tolypocladium ophioglossoides CBS 100239]|uniref:Uncharacterized protein n=1 Tax=Tolypocladium ophioglossoides (strain CBS 100239) TaxID=1163406 RepID=A0A0L0MXC7_TOLOC|nr:hypothetical protein TOPH_08908 [Tolypocladium ophioglossoides CBS 100239]